MLVRATAVERGTSAMRNEELAEAMSHLLRRRGVESRLRAEAAGSGFLRRKTTEIYLQLEGQEIDSIWVSDYHTGGEPGSGMQHLFRCCYRVLLNRSLTQESAAAALWASAKLVRKHKLLGILQWGQVNDVRWDGGRLAESLNQDGNLSRMLVDNAELWFDGNIEAALVEGEPLVDIFSPGLYDLWPCPRRGDEDHLKHLLEDEEEDFLDFLDSVLPYEPYAKIAQHVRSTPVVS